MDKQMNILSYKSQTLDKKNRMILLAGFAFVSLLILMAIGGFAFATAGADDIKTVLKPILNIVCMIFTTVGVILTVYSVGQLIMAFKNEDADSKSRASTMLVVGVCLIIFPSIVKGLKVIDKIGTAAF